MVGAPAHVGWRFKAGAPVDARAAAQRRSCKNVDACTAQHGKTVVVVAQRGRRVIGIGVGPESWLAMATGKYNSGMNGRIMQGQHFNGPAQHLKSQCLLMAAPIPPMPMVSLLY